MNNLFSAPSYNFYFFDTQKYLLIKIPLFIRQLPNVRKRHTEVQVRFP